VELRRGIEQIPRYKEAVDGVNIFVGAPEELSSFAGSVADKILSKLGWDFTE